MKMYFLDVHLHNNEEYNIVAVWQEWGKEENETIPAGGSIAHSVVMKARKQPSPAIYAAYNPENLDIVKLNGKEKLEVQPTLSHNWVTANAGNEQGLFLYFFILRMKREIVSH